MTDVPLYAVVVGRTQRVPVIDLSTANLLQPCRALSPARQTKSGFGLFERIPSLVFFVWRLAENVILGSIVTIRRWCMGVRGGTVKQCIVNINTTPKKELQRLWQTVEMLGFLPRFCHNVVLILQKSNFRLLFGVGWSLTLLASVLHGGAIYHSTSANNPSYQRSGLQSSLLPYSGLKPRSGSGPQSSLTDKYEPWRNQDEITPVQPVPR